MGEKGKNKLILLKAKMFSLFCGLVLFGLVQVGLIRVRHWRLEMMIAQKKFSGEKMDFDDFSNLLFARERKCFVIQRMTGLKH